MSRSSLFVGLAAGVFLFGGAEVRADQKAAAGKTPPKTAQAWTLDEALSQITLNPDNVYLQYVALQLARPEKRVNEVAGRIERLTRQRGRPADRQVDLFALFTGALAVQESLQLDTMRADAPGLTGHIGDPARETVPVAELKGPTIKSHPWGKMLAAQAVAGKKPEVSPLAMCVPDDQYFALFHSIGKLLEAAEVGDLWGAHVLSQASGSAKTQRTSDRLKTQLAIQTDPITRPFYDMVVDEVAFTGSDLYFREGTDVTMLFALKQPKVFKVRMDGFLAAAEKSRPDAVRSTGKILGIDYVAVTSPDRAIHAFSAYPRPDLHVRSNSKAALERVLSVVAGRTGDQQASKPLGASTEFKYIRTIMPRGAKEEDGLIYLSDPFIRRIVGPELKLTERRRMLCYNHLRMIGHAAMLYRTQFGKRPESLEQLAESGCSPAVFGRGKLSCPCGGTYKLSADGTSAVCSHHGHAGELVPCSEISVGRVTKKEAEQYNEFLEGYNQYWRTYFDPIAVRLQLTPKQYSAETIILPLLDNSIYTGMAMSLGGETEPLDGLPVPKRNIFSMVVRLNKEGLLGNEKMLHGLLDGLNRASFDRQLDAATIEQVLRRGVGNQLGLHIYDASPMFDFNLTGFLGDLTGRFRSVGGGGLSGEMIPISFLVASLNTPVYLAVPVDDPQLVDKFLNKLDATLAGLARHPQRGGWLNLDHDFYKVPLEGSDARVRCYSVRFGPVKWRLFFARIGDGLYVASKRFILDDLAAAQKERSQAAARGEKIDRGPSAHAMVRVRPEHWNKVLPTFRLGWAESSRQSCLDNLGSLSNVARAVTASGKQATPEVIHRQADLLHGVHFFCPDGGRYELGPDGKQITCSVHGSALAPRQQAAPAAESPMGRLMQQFAGLTATLTFLEDGLHAVVTIDRK